MRQTESGESETIEEVMHRVRGREFVHKEMEKSEQWTVEKVCELLDATSYEEVWEEFPYPEMVFFTWCVGKEVDKDLLPLLYHDFTEYFAEWWGEVAPKIMAEGVEGYFKNVSDGAKFW